MAQRRISVMMVNEDKRHANSTKSMLSKLIFYGKPQQFLSTSHVRESIICLFFSRNIYYIITTFSIFYMGIYSSNAHSDFATVGMHKLVLV